MIYFDNAATTCVFPEVVEAMQDAMQVTYGNPSAKHMKGIEAENKVKAAQELRAKPKEILFTSGGTESNNTAIIGTAMANRRKGKHIITTKVEHASVYEPMYHLEEEGYEVTYLDVDSEGIVDLDQLEESIREDTILVSCMMVNNEIGAIEPIEEIAKIIKAKNPNTIFHVDAIQAYGKLPIVPKNMGIDLLSTSGHKIHGPKGVGFLYVRNGVKIHKLILGGGQQKGMRSGTDNVPGIAGLGCAAKEAYTDFDKKVTHLCELKQFFMEEVQKIPDTVLNSLPGDQGAPHIVSVSFAGVRSEVLLHALEERGIQVSSGSACSSNKKLPVSPVLKEIGLKKDLLDSTVRFSFCENTTKEELEYCLQQLKELLVVLRRYSRH
mgnify:CR=1 FL=1